MKAPTEDICKYNFSNIGIFFGILRKNICIKGNIAVILCWTTVSLPELLPAGLKGNPVKVRDCARSCVILNGSYLQAIET